MAGKYDGKRAKTRRPWEFKKKLAAWAVLIATATAVASYVLAYLDKQTASDVTTTIFTACIGYLVSYAAASTTEKVSRNRHGLDADGNPFQTNNTEGGPTPADLPSDKNKEDLPCTTSPLSSKLWPL